jgi:hypothetical protein
MRVAFAANLPTKIYGFFDIFGDFSDQKLSKLGKSVNT